MVLHVHTTFTNHIDFNKDIKLWSKFDTTGVLKKFLVLVHIM